MVGPKNGTIGSSNERNSNLRAISGRGYLTLQQSVHGKFAAERGIVRALVDELGGGWCSVEAKSRHPGQVPLQILCNAECESVEAAIRIQVHKREDGQRRKVGLPGCRSNLPGESGGAEHNRQYQQPGNEARAETTVRRGRLGGSDLLLEAPKFRDIRAFRDFDQYRIPLARTGVIPG